MKAAAKRKSDCSVGEAWSTGNCPGQSLGGLGSILMYFERQAACLLWWCGKIEADCELWATWAELDVWWTTDPKPVSCPKVETVQLGESEGIIACLGREKAGWLEAPLPVSKRKHSAGQDEPKLGLEESPSPVSPRRMAPSYSQTDWPVPSEPRACSL